MRGALRAGDTSAALRPGERAVALELTPASAPDVRLLEPGRRVDVVIVDGGTISRRRARTRAALAGERALGRHHGHRACAGRGRARPGNGRRRSRSPAATARRRPVIVRLALLGGDAVLDQELRTALADLPGIALLAPAHSADADILLAADSSLAAAGDLVRGERSRRSDARVLLIANAGAEAAHRQALECGAVGVMGRPIDAAAVRQALAAAGCFDSSLSARTADDEGHIALLGAGGGMGTTTCAIALAARLDRAFVLDLALAMGDAADAAGAEVIIPDALLRIACGPVSAPSELGAAFAAGGSSACCRRRRCRSMRI